MKTQTRLDRVGRVGRVTPLSITPRVVVAAFRHHYEHRSCWNSTVARGIMIPLSGSDGFAPVRITTKSDRVRPVA